MIFSKCSYIVIMEMYEDRRIENFRSDFSGKGDHLEKSVQNPDSMPLSQDASKLKMLNLSWGNHHI